MLTQLLELHSIKESLIDSIGHSTSESRGVVVFFYFPYGDWVHGLRESSIDPPREGPKWCSVPGDSGQLSWLVITSESFAMRLDKHVDKPCEVGKCSLLPFLLVHWERALRLKFSTQAGEDSSCFGGVHQQRLDDIVQHVRPRLKVGSEHPPQFRWLSSGLYYLPGVQTKTLQRLLHFRQGGSADLSTPSTRITKMLANGANISPKSLWLFKETRIRLHCIESSNRRTKSERVMPTALQICRSSIRSSRRSPDSYLLTKDCGWRRRLAKPTWVRPASALTCRRSFCRRAC